MKKIFSTPKLLLSCSAALCLACGTTQPTTQKTAAPDLPAPGADQRYAPNWPEVAATENRYIQLDLDSPAVCDVEIPYFDFDKSQVLAQYPDELDHLVDCLQAPEHREANVILVGRTDARGTSDYNQRLGLQRAEAVRDMLVELGLSPSRLQVISRGERGAEASSSPQVGHGYDRRVDVVVLQVIEPR